MDKKYFLIKNKFSFLYYFLFFFSYSEKKNYFNPFYKRETIIYTTREIKPKSNNDNKCNINYDKAT